MSWTARGSTVLLIGLVCRVFPVRALQKGPVVDASGTLSCKLPITSQQETYQSWIARYQHELPAGALGAGRSVHWAITTIAGDNPELGATKAPFQGCDQSVVTQTFAVSDEGDVSMTRHTALAIQGGGPGSLSAGDFKRLKLLMLNLPKDFGRLPPRGRRLVVQVVTRKGVLARVYDRADLPESVLEMLRLVGADVWPIFEFPNFQPNERWKQSDLEKSGISADAIEFRENDRRILAVDSERDLKVIEINPSRYFNSTVHVERLRSAGERSCDPSGETTLRITDGKNGTVLHEFREPMVERRFVYTYAARFTPDHRRLLLLSSLPAVRIYDTSTWKLLDTFPGVPPEAAAYYPSQDWKRGVAVFPSGEVSLVNARTGRKLARIDSGDDLQSVVFSPDGSQVAVVTVGKDGDHVYTAHLRIWATDTGRMEGELRPLEATPRDAFGQPVWWPDGRYLVAPTREGHFGRPSIVGIWNVQSGRYRGALAGCTLLDTPWTVFRLQGYQFYKQCEGGDILRWDLQSDIRTLAEFEKSLTRGSK